MYSKHFYVIQNKHASRLRECVRYVPVFMQEVYISLAFFHACSSTSRLSASSRRSAEVHYNKTVGWSHIDVARPNYYVLTCKTRLKALFLILEG